MCFNDDRRTLMTTHSRREQ